MCHGTKIEGLFALAELMDPLGYLNYTRTAVSISASHALALHDFR